MSLVLVMASSDETAHACIYTYLYAYVSNRDVVRVGHGERIHVAVKEVSACFRQGG